MSNTMLSHHLEPSETPWSQSIKKAIIHTHVPEFGESLVGRQSGILWQMLPGPCGLQSYPPLAIRDLICPTLPLVLSVPAIWLTESYLLHHRAFAHATLCQECSLYPVNSSSFFKSQAKCNFLKDAFSPSLVFVRHHIAFSFFLNLKKLW